HSGAACARRNVRRRTVSKLSTILLALTWAAVAPRASAQSVAIPLGPAGPMSLAGLDVAIRIAQRMQLGDLGSTSRLPERLVPPASRNPREPGDSLYRLARRAMADENYRRAAQLFAELVDRYPRSDYAGDALYYRAYSLYQLGGQRDLHDAIDAIEL